MAPNHYVPFSAFFDRIKQVEETDARPSDLKNRYRRFVAHIVDKQIVSPFKRKPNGVLTAFLHDWLAEIEESYGQGYWNDTTNPRTGFHFKDWAQELRTFRKGEGSILQVAAIHYRLHASEEYVKIAKLVDRYLFRYSSVERFRYPIFEYYVDQNAKKNQQDESITYHPTEYLEQEIYIIKHPFHQWTAIDADIRISLEPRLVEICRLSDYFRNPGMHTNRAEQFNSLKLEFERAVKPINEGELFRVYRLASRYIGASIPSFPGRSKWRETIVKTLNGELPAALPSTLMVLYFFEPKALGKLAREMGIGDLLQPQSGQ